MSKSLRRSVIHELVFEELSQAQFPLKSVQDLCGGINLKYLGINVTLWEAAGAAVSLRHRGLAAKRKVFGGIYPLISWVDWRGAHLSPGRRVYWYLKARQIEILPMKRREYLEQMK